MRSAETSQSDADARQADVIRRRRLLLALAATALLIIIAAGVLQLTKDKKADTQRETKLQDPAKTVVLERFPLTATKRERGRGLAELVRRNDKTALRVLAVGLKPSTNGGKYQLRLAGGKAQSKLLGSQTVTGKRTFVGEADLSSKDLHEYSRIELRRISGDSPPSDRLVLRGRIPD